MSQANRPAAALLPLGAIAAGFGLIGHAVQAQEAVTEMAPISVRAHAESDKESVRATTTTIGKGRQELRDVPQSITVVTERLIDDRNLDTLKDTLRTTAGISFQAAEGQEEDIRLRGFALQSTGDIFLDGMRDPGFYDRDSFNWDRLEVLRGSASMLFGRGSTGGAVNQVNKQPFLMNQGEASVTLGTQDYMRSTVDVNRMIGEDAALRLNAMVMFADGDGNRIDKYGIAPTVRFGIGTRNEFSLGLYHLEYDNGIDYGYPWLNQQVSSAFKPGNYYGAASDYMAGGTTYGTATHVHRFNGSDELRTVIRAGKYERDQRASAIRFCQPNPNTGALNASCPQVTEAVTAASIGPDTVLTRGSQNKIQDMDAVYVQSDYTARWKLGGREHAISAGVDGAIEDFTRYAASVPAGVSLTKPTTTIGTPNDGGAVDESRRIINRSQHFDADALGVYAQDLFDITPTLKGLAGLRWDRFGGSYRTFATTASGTTQIGDQTAERSRRDALWSRRFGILYQPTADQSYHLSYGTSFNTSGDTYSFDPLGSNTAPEKSRNIELGGSLDWAQKRFTTRFALFHATKFNERNRDVDSVDASNYVLSGKRHAAGLDLDFAGRLTAAWELFTSYSWIPSAKVDSGASDGTTLITGETVGARPAMTPRHSGSIWTTYRLSPEWRIGGGINARSKLKPLLTDFDAPGHVTADLMVEYSTGPAQFKLNLSNVTDKLYADQLYRGHWIAGKQRTLQLTSTILF